MNVIIYVIMQKLTHSSHD